MDRTKYIYDGWNLVAELDDLNRPRRTYAWGLDLSGSEQGAGGVSGCVYLTPWSLSGTTPVKGASLFGVYDGNGNATSWRSSNGEIAAAFDYGPFGETLAARGPLAGAVPLRFSTKYTDSESGLLYYGYRYYNPGTGRWMNRDPSGETSQASTLAICKNDIISHVDIWGLWTFKHTNANRSSFRRAVVIPDEGDSVVTAALTYRLNWSESSKWLHDDTHGKWISTHDQIDACAEYSIPNTVYVTTGTEKGSNKIWPFDWYEWQEISYRAGQAADGFRNHGYFVVDTDDVVKSELIEQFADPNIYFMFFSTHGHEGTVFISDYNDPLGITNITPEQLLPHQHHKLAALIMYCCEADQYHEYYMHDPREYSWKSLVSGNGLLWATTGNIYPNFTVWYDLPVR